MNEYELVVKRLRNLDRRIHTYYDFCHAARAYLAECGVKYAECSNVIGMLKYVPLARGRERDKVYYMREIARCGEFIKAREEVLVDLYVDYDGMRERLRALGVSL
jgi:hypothetical protein